MTKRTEDKSNGYGKAIRDLEIFIWQELFNAFQKENVFTYQRGPYYS